MRTADVACDEFLFHAIGRALRGLDSAGRRLDVRLVPCGGEGSSPLRAILSTVGLPADLTLFQARDALRLLLLDQHTVFVLHEQCPLDAKEWVRFADQVEHLRKAAQPVALCAIALDARGVVPAKPACDFQAGQALHQVLALSDPGSDVDRWQAYLHQRACWDAAGNLSMAGRLSVRLEQVSPGDDEHVEAILQEQAHVQMECTGKAGALVAFLSSRRPHATERMALQERLLLWRPPGSQGLSVVPWAARALLASGAPEQKVLALRHALVCAPLAAEILAVCLHAEAQIRSELHADGRLGEPSEDTRSLQERFVAGQAEGTVFPKAHPARPVRPVDGWAFSSLGETLHLASREAVAPRESLDACWRVLHLRNSVAHGHYVCWAHVSQAVAAIRRFGAG